MKPLFVLFIGFVLALLLTGIGQGVPNWSFSGRLAMSGMLMFTALGHFKFLDGMSRMLPAGFPAKRMTVIVTGFMEIAAAIGLHVAQLRSITAWLLIVFFMLILPANISAAGRHLNYATGEENGLGPRYLWFRIPMQLFLIAWVYVFAVARC